MSGPYDVRMLRFLLGWGRGCFFLIDQVYSYHGSNPLVRVFDGVSIRFWIFIQLLLYFGRKPSSSKRGDED